MKKGETFFERTLFAITIAFKMLTLPLYSLPRLERYCKSCLNKNPKAYSPRWFLAGVYKDYQRNEEAKKEYLEIKNLGYMTDQDQLSLGQVLFRLKDIQGVIETLAPIIDKYPKKRDSNWYLGVCYAEKEDFQKAVHYLEKAILAGSKWYLNYWKPRLWIDYLLEKIERSTDIYSKGGYSDYWRLGFCYDRLGQLEKALEVYTTALSLKPDSSELKRNMALVYLKIGQSLLSTDLHRAEAEFKKALDIDPGNPDAIKLLEGLRPIRNLQSLN